MPNREHERLSDRIMTALNLAIQQNDTETAQMLRRALDMSMTRNSGGHDFVERRTLNSNFYDIS